MLYNYNKIHGAKNKKVCVRARACVHEKAICSNPTIHNFTGDKKT